MRSVAFDFLIQRNTQTHDLAGGWATSLPYSLTSTNTNCSGRGENGVRQLPACVTKLGGMGEEPHRGYAVVYPKRNR